MSEQKGKQSLLFDEAPYLMETHSIVGKKEGEGPMKSYFHEIQEDPYLGQDSWEEAESQFQKKAVESLITKSGLKASDIRYIFAGDLLGQTIASSFGLSSFNIPLIGLYGACSTSGESIMVASMTVAAGYADVVAAVTSSHFGGAEKQFRFPLEYGNQRPLSSTWTVTGSGAFLVGKSRSHIRITGVTTGKIVDYGVKDSMNMGACMAPAAADTIYNNLVDFEVTADSYDKIITGDLGAVGSRILYDLLEKKGVDIMKQHMDCGIEMFGVNEKILPSGQSVEPGCATRELQKFDVAQIDTSFGDLDVHCGGSGCGCAAAILSSYIIPKVECGAWKKVLFVPTGALLSTTSYNEGLSVPGIAHGIVLEHI